MGRKYRGIVVASESGEAEEIGEAVWSGSGMSGGSPREFQIGIGKWQGEGKG